MHFARPLQLDVSSSAGQRANQVPCPGPSWLNRDRSPQDHLYNDTVCIEKCGSFAEHPSRSGQQEPRSARPRRPAHWLSTPYLVVALALTARRPPPVSMQGLRGESDLAQYQCLNGQQRRTQHAVRDGEQAPAKSRSNRCLRHKITACVVQWMEQPGLAGVFYSVRTRLYSVGLKSGQGSGGRRLLCNLRPGGNESTTSPSPVPQKTSYESDRL